LREHGANLLNVGGKVGGTLAVRLAEKNISKIKGKSGQNHLAANLANVELGGGRCPQNHVVAYAEEDLPLPYSGK
jgi:hypothetical protein